MSLSIGKKVQAIITDIDGNPVGVTDGGINVNIVEGSAGHVIIDNATLEVTVDASDGDNIAIVRPDGTNPLLPNADGSLNVNIAGSGFEISNDVGNPIPISAINLDVALSTRAAEHTSAASPHAARLTDGAAFYKATTPADTQPVSAATLPLPTGAATAANQLPNNHQVTVSNPITGFALETTLGSVLTELQQKTEPTDTQPISAAALPLPSGAATSALQTTGNTSLSNIDGKLNSLGQKTMAASVPVVISSDQSPVAVSGTVTSTAQPGVDIGDVTINNAAGAGAVNIQDGGNSITIDATSLPLPTGAATETTLGTRLADTTFTGRINTQGQKTMAASTPIVIASDQTAVPASQSGTWNINNISGTVSLPTGAATLTEQQTQSASLASIDAGTPAALGQTTMSASQPVTMASDQSPIGVSLATVTVANINKNRTGLYYYSTSAFTVQATADAATAGRGWLINPVGSAVSLKLLDITFTSQLGSALVAVTSPRITVELVTFTGTASGAQINPAKNISSAPANTGSFRTASTGLSLTAGNGVCTFLPVASATAVAYSAAGIDSKNFRPNEGLVLGPGEGIVIRQADNGTASDTRRYLLNLTVEEL